MRKFLLFAVSIVVGIAALAHAFAPSKRGDPGKLEVATLSVTRSTLVDSTIATGTVKSKVGAEVKVGSQLSGIVSKLYVGIGDNVKKGDLLASLDDRQWKARVASLEAQLAAAIGEAGYAESELDRMARLRSSISALQLEDRRRNVKVKRAVIEEVRANLAEAQTQLGYVRITAPVSGTVASVSTYEGETVAASFAAPTFVTIIDLNRLEVQAYVDETDIGKVHAGEKVTFRVDSYPDQELEGVVRTIYPKPQFVNNVVNYIVIVDIQDMRGLLIRPEMTAHVNFVLNKRKDMLAVPRSAVLQEDRGSFVIARDADVWNKRAVRIGLRTPQRVEILSGIAAGDVIAADTGPWRNLKE